jgi:hypothetical protein
MDDRYGDGQRQVARARLVTPQAGATVYCNGNNVSNFYHHDYAYSNDSAGNSYAADGNSITITRHCG